MFASVPQGDAMILKVSLYMYIINGYISNVDPIDLWFFFLFIKETFLNN